MASLTWCDAAMDGEHRTFIEGGVEECELCGLRVRVEKASEYRVNLLAIKVLQADAQRKRGR